MDEIDYGALLLFNTMLIHTFFYTSLSCQTKIMDALLNKASMCGHYAFNVESVFRELVFTSPSEEKRNGTPKADRFVRGC